MINARDEADSKDTAAEANAALLALGQKLKWAEIEMGWDAYRRQKRVTLSSQGGGKSYLIVHDTPAAFLLAIDPNYVSPTPYRIMNVSDNKDVPPRQYPTIEAAKAACERHNATGQWQ